MLKVAIIGGGLAGLSLATELVDEGFDVELFEKNSYLGGRASSTPDKETKNEIPIGPHVFMTSYNNMHRFFHKIGVKNKVCWERTNFIDVVYKGSHDQLKMNNLPPPFYLIPMLWKDKMLSWKDKLNGIKLMKISLVSQDDMEKLDTTNAYTYLKNNGISDAVIDKFFRFLTLSLLNVPLELCSAADFCILLKYWASLRHRNFGFARGGLGAIYRDQAIEYILKKKGKIHLNTEVVKIVEKDGTIDHVLVKKGRKKSKIRANVYVSATTPIDLRKVLSKELLFTPFFENLQVFEGVPYISVALWFDKKITTKKFWALLNTAQTTDYLNTDFYDQSNIYPERMQGSFVTSNIIYSKAYESMSDKEIVAKTVEEIRETFPSSDAKLLRSHVNRIPYVIYAPYPGVRKHKPGNKTPLSNFYLAGDWIVREFPQSMESAVRSGYRCAERILADRGIAKKICDSKVF